MTKMESHSRLVYALRVFTGERPACYASEKEFFLVSMGDMEEYLRDLQSETLAEARAGFIRDLEAGRVKPETIDTFKAVLDPLVSNSDFKAVCAGMAGSREFVKSRLLAVKPLSLLDEAKKDEALRDPDARRRLSGAYSRLNFPALLKQVEAAPHDLAANAALAKARAEISDYCGVYKVPLRGADTLTPFSMSCVDAALAAAYLLFKGVNRATRRDL
ncbi:MAG: hypothetical protein A2179_06230 [Elusimicrobia bacterium GWC2_63_65]|nr:MAG: hypothetical protein A2179_06230 [Elusimicrobia bacterium GWC2_63_65]